MKYFAILLMSLLFSVASWGQTVTDILFPQYVQGVGTLSMPDEKRVPFAYRLRISGLAAAKTYRYYNRVVTDPTSLSPGDGGNYILVKQSGAFVRATAISFTNSTRYGEFTTDASGSYEGWFVLEPSQIGVFSPGTKLYARITLNDGNDGTTSEHFLTSNNFVTVINFGNTEMDGTGIRSTAASSGAAKNFVFLYDNEAGTGRPIAGTFIEGDGTAGTLGNGYADFYADNVNEADRTWGTIIPNNLTNGIRRIAQYSLATGTEIGSRTSADGTWAKAGGDRVTTAMAKGGITDVRVLNGDVVNLGTPGLIPQTITFNTLTEKTYGDEDFDPGATVPSFLPITYTSSNPAIAEIMPGNTIHIKGVGTVDITAAQGGDVDFAAASPVVQTLTIKKAPLTIKANDVTRLQGENNPAFTVVYSGFVNSENESVLTTAAQATTTATAASPIGTYPITPSGANAANYEFIYVDGVLTVNALKVPQTITFHPPTPKTYGAPDFSAGASVTSNLPLTYASTNQLVATIDNNGQFHIVGAGTTTITVSQPGDNAFLPAIPVSHLLVVNQASLTITADNKTKLTGQPNPNLTISYLGFVNGENNSVLSTQPLISTTATTGSAVGDYPITVEGAIASNYNISFVNGTLTVEPLLSQVISFAPLAVKRYGDANFETNASVNSGLPLTYTSSDPQVATINGGIIDVLLPGTTDITVSQPGDATHAAAVPVTYTLRVEKANLTITALDEERNEGAVNPPLQFHYAGFVNGEDATALSIAPTIATTATPASLPGKYPILVGGAVAANYNIGYVQGRLLVNPQNSKDQDIVNAYANAPGKMTINFSTVEAQKVNVQLFDTYGNRLLDVKMSASQGMNTWQFETGNLAAGVYPVRIVGKDLLVKTKVFIR